MVKSMEEMRKLADKLARLIDPAAFPGHLGRRDPGDPHGVQRARRTAQAIIDAFPAITQADLIEAQAKEIEGLRGALQAIAADAPEVKIGANRKTYAGGFDAARAWAGAIAKRALLSPSDSGRGG